MSEIFIYESRGEVVECIHRGDSVVVDPLGKTIAFCGDPEKFTYLRSSAKPLQALNVIMSGAAKMFGLTAEELAVICSSHYAQDFHLQVVRSILAKIGLDESALQSGITRSILSEIAFAQAEAGIKPQRILSDCSGKHSGMLATCMVKGYPICSYLDPQHPVQQEIITILAEICAYPRDKIAIGVDGCNVPVFAMPIRNMALGFARLVNPQYLPDIYVEPANQIFTAMNEHPQMVSGTNGFCTELMKATKNRMIGKIGAQGVYCIGIREPQIGIALKIEDGAPGMASMAAMHVLTEMELLSSSEYEKLSRYHKHPNFNDDNKQIGNIYPIFRLNHKHT